MSRVQTRLFVIGCSSNLDVFSFIEFELADFQLRGKFFECFPLDKVQIFIFTIGNSSNLNIYSSQKTTLDSANYIEFKFGCFQLDIVQMLGAYKLDAYNWRILWMLPIG